MNVGAFDFTLIHLYGPDQRIKLQSEVFAAHQNEVVNDETIDGDHNVWGIYGLFDLRFHKQWSAGVRLDYVELIDNLTVNPDDRESGYTAYATFHQTEFARWRVQYNRLELATGEHDNQVLLQGIFAIGEHKHKLE